MRARDGEAGKLELPPTTGDLAKLRRMLILISHSQKEGEKKSLNGKKEVRCVLVLAN